MKVVLFCGGLGMRLREYSEAIPKPMVDIGNRPILWHVMKYYAQFGHKEFILCLGWKGDVIKEFFLKYNECAANNFVLSQGGKNVDLLSSDIDDWKITFVDTGMTSNIGQRLVAVEEYLEGDTQFLANYSDGVCDIDINRLIDFHDAREAIGTFVSVRPSQSFHVVDTDRLGGVSRFQDIGSTETWMNGGFFVFDRRIFDYIHEGEELVNEPFDRLMDEEKLFALQHHGFWSCMDTYKEKQALDDLFDGGRAPWMIWSQGNQRLSEIHA